jgi:hypothetical protein
MKSKTIFKEKDRVYVTSLGWGKVIDAGCSTPSGWVGIETNSGRIIHVDTYLVSFTEYTLEGFSQDRPEESPNKGDIVWIREMETKMYVPIVFIEAIKEHYVLSFNFIDIKTVHKDFVETKNPYI